MKPRNREINIFNMSMLDVLSCALGAFLVIMIVLFPYYRKETIDYQQIIKKLNKELFRAEEGKAAAEKKAKKEAAKAAAAEAAAAEAKAAAAEAKAEKQQAMKELKKADDKLKKAITFTLLGIATNAKSFVVVIDMSGSMKAYNTPMLNTVDAIINQLDIKDKIQIIGYQGESSAPKIHRWQPAPRMAEMTPSAKSEAVGYVRQLTGMFDGKTPTHAALLEAISYPAEAVILLTDGAPNTNPGGIVSDITMRNNGQKEIHTVAIGDYHANPALTIFLQTLSKENRGGFLGVTR